MRLLNFKNFICYITVFICILIVGLTACNTTETPTLSPTLLPTKVNQVVSTSTLLPLPDPTDTAQPIVETQTPIAPTTSPLSTQLEVEQAQPLELIKHFDVKSEIVDSQTGNYTPQKWKIMTFIDDYAYNVIENQILEIVDFSDRVNPIALGQYQAPSPIVQVAATLDYAFVFLEDRRMLTLWVTDPANPVEIASYTLPQRANDVVIEGNYVYVAVWESGLHIIDISVPNAPTEVITYRSPYGSVRGVVLEENYAYLLADGLQILDVSNPAVPIELGFSEYFCSDPLGYPPYVAIVDHYVYLAWTRGDMGTRGWCLIDATDPTSPLPININYAEGGRMVKNVLVSKNNLYLDTMQGFRIFDITTPTMPIYTGFEYQFSDTGWEGQTENVIMVDNYIYHTTVGGELFILQTNPLQLTLPSPSITINPVNHLGGKTNAIANKDKFAYVGFGPELAIFDMSNPAQPLKVGNIILADTLAMQQTIIQDINLINQYAYVLTVGNLYIIDISNPAQPTQIKSLLLEGSGQAITSRENYIYLVERHCSRPGSHVSCHDVIKQLDISNPITPIIANTYSLSSSSSDYLADSQGDKNIIAIGNYLYLTHPQVGLKITDMASGISGPVYVGFADIVFKNNYAYITDANRGDVRIFDLSNTITPTLLGRYNTLDQFTGAIDIVNNTLYVAESTNPYLQKDVMVYGMRILDISNPITATQLGFYPTSSPIKDLTVVDSYAYLATDSGLQIIDISNPTTPVNIGQYKNLDEANKIIVNNNHTYILGNKTQVNFYTLDTTNAKEPKIDGVVSGNYDYITIKDNYTYISKRNKTSNKHQLHILDISTLANPKEIAVYNDWWYGEMSANNNYVYIHGNSGGTIATAFELSQSITATQVGMYQLPQSIYRNEFTIVENLIYLAASEMGLHIVDISDPSNLVKIGSIEAINAQQVSVVDNYAYVATTKGLHIIDVSNPTAPTLISAENFGLFGATWFIEDLTIANNYAYLVDSRIGLRVVDISNPTAPIEVGYHPISGEVENVAVIDGYIYVAAKRGGLFIFEVNSVVD